MGTNLTKNRNFPFLRTPGCTQKEFLLGGYTKTLSSCHQVQVHAGGDLFPSVDVCSTLPLSTSQRITSAGEGQGHSQEDTALDAGIKVNGPEARG